MTNAPNKRKRKRKANLKELDSYIANLVVNHRIAKALDQLEEINGRAAEATMSADEAPVITQEAEDEQPQCSNCAYWIIMAKLADNRGGRGECHRLAPSLPKYIDGKRMEWPETLAVDWCGQYTTIGRRPREPGPFISPRFKRPYKPTTLAE